MATPLSIVYQQSLGNRDFLVDPEQERVVERLEILHKELVRSGPNQPQNLIHRLRKRLSDSPVLRPKGIYIWGGVGRGPFTGVHGGVHGKAVS